MYVYIYIYCRGQSCLGGRGGGAVVVRVSLEWGEWGWGKRTLDVPSLVSAFAKAILTICARKGAS